MVPSCRNFHSLWAWADASNHTTCVRGVVSFSSSIITTVQAFVSNGVKFSPRSHVLHPSRSPTICVEVALPCCVSLSFSLPYLLLFSFLAFCFQANMSDTPPPPLVYTDFSNACVCFSCKRAVCSRQVSASSDHTIRVWGPDWECCRTLECSGVWSLNVFNDRLVSGSLDNAVKVWGA